MTFSGTISLSDLNDYIAPSQACVVALNGAKVQLKLVSLGTEVMSYIKHNVVCCNLYLSYVELVHIATHS